MNMVPIRRDACQGEGKLSKRNAAENSVRDEGFVSQAHRSQISSDHLRENVSVKAQGDVCSKISLEFQVSKVSS
jgi:hypothetical protein